MNLPCGVRKEAMKQAMGDKKMGVCWKGIGSTGLQRKNNSDTTAASLFTLSTT